MRAAWSEVFCNGPGSVPLTRGGAVGWKVATIVLGVVLAAVTGLGAWQLSVQRSQIQVVSADIPALRSVTSTTDLAKELKSASASLSKTEAQVSILEASVGVLKYDAGISGDNSGTLESQITAVQGTVSTLQGNVSSLQETVDCFRQDESYVWSGSFTC